MTWKRLASTIGLALFVAACGAEVTEAPKALRPVRTTEATISDGVDRVSFAGVARSGLESQLSFRVSGTVLTVPVELGQSVRRGQVLARVDPTDYELGLEEAKAAVAQSEAALRRAESDYDRVRALYENNNASRSELDAGRASAESARAQVDAATKQLERSRRQVGYTTLRAPQAGAIAEVAIEIGEFVSSGQTAFVLSAGDRPEVELAVPEVAIAGVAKGQTVRVRFDALPGETFSGTVREVGVAATGGATFQVIVRLDAANPSVRSGMAAEGVFELPNPSGAGLFVPLVSVGEDPQGRYVLVVEDQGDGTGLVRRRGVVVGRLIQGGMEIVEGLEAGESVATAGVRRLSDGMQVRILGTAEGAP